MASLPPDYYLKALQEAGDEELADRPSIPNPEGGLSTVFSESANFGGTETLYPRAADRKILSSREAQDRHIRTGHHLGKFRDVESAMRYGQMLHEDQAQRQFGEKEKSGRWITPSWKRHMDQEKRALEIKKMLEKLGRK